MSWMLKRFYITSQGRLKAEVQETITLNGESVLHVHHSDMGLWADWEGKSMAEAIVTLQTKLNVKPPMMPPGWTIPAAGQMIQ